MRLAAVTIFAAGLVASAAVGAAEVLPRVEDGIARDSRLTSADRRHAGGNRLGLDPAPFDAFRARLRPRQRYAVDVPEGEKGPFITRGAVVRDYSAFFFLPAIEVVRRADAELVFRYRLP